MQSKDKLIDVRQSKRKSKFSEYERNRKMITRELYIKRKNNERVVYIANNNEIVVDSKGKKELFSSPEHVKITGKVGD